MSRPRVFSSLIDDRMQLEQTRDSILCGLLSALVTPLEYASVNEWREHVARTARDAIGGQHSQVSLDPLCGLEPLRSPDLDPALIADYQRRWVTLDPVPATVAHHGVNAYVRSDLMRRLPKFGDRYERSAILNDFYRPASLHDAAGVLRRRPQFMQLTVFSARRSDARFRRSARQVLPLAAPGFLAGAQQILNVASVRGQFVRNVDTIQTAIALYDAAGGRVHWNRALVVLVQQLGGSTELERQLSVCGRHLAGMAAGPSLGLRMAEVTNGTMRWRLQHLTIVGSFARLGIEGTPPLVMLQVVVEARGLASVQHSLSPSGTDTLTPREREIGWLIARGARNRAIAVQLGISEHTARRHTEKVLKKLQVDSRAAVAQAMERFAIKTFSTGDT